MKIKFLGTAAAEGIPALFCSCETCKIARKNGGKELRTRSQALINDRLLLDFPAETYAHSLLNNFELNKIHNFLITHTHEDHFYPQDIAMIAKMFSNIESDSPKYHFYGGSEMVSFARPFADKTDGLVDLFALEPFKTSKIDNFLITPLIATHTTKTPYIYIINDGEKQMLYAHDTGLFCKETEDYLFDRKPFFDLVSFDCCCGSWPDEDYGTHLSFGNVKRISKKMLKEGLINSSSVLCVNHFSHNASDVLYESRKIYENEGYIMTYDGLEIVF